MRILVANDLYGHTSAAGVAVAMAEGLARRGHEVAFLATTQQPGQGRVFESSGVEVHEVETPAYPLRWRAWRSLKNPGGVAAMTDLVARFRPDVVHVHNLHIHLSYAALAAARGAASPAPKTILHVHDAMPVCHQKLFCHLDERIVPGDRVVYRNGPIKCALCVRGRYNPFRNGTIRRVLARDVDTLVAVSDEMGRLLAENGIGPATTIFNGLPGDQVSASPGAVAALRQRLGLTHHKVIFYGGRLDRLKGGLELVRALEVVRRTVPDTVLLTVGEALPGFYEELVALAARLGMPSALVSAGWLRGEELSAAYALADVVATPSLCFESFGLVNLQAMLAGRPVVASMWGGPSDLVVDGQTGYLVNPLRVNAMGRRLTRLLTDEPLARAMGAAGRRRALRGFGLETQLDQVEALYRDLLGAPRP